MYLDHFGLIDFPFIQSGKDELFFVTPSMGKQVVRLQHWLDCGHDFLLISGEQGSGRTALIQHAFRNSSFSIQSVSVSGLTLSDTQFLQYIALELGIDELTVVDLMSVRHALKQYLRSRADDASRVCIIVQQAEQLPESQLNLLRDLAYDADFYLPLCSVVLIGDTHYGKQEARSIKAQPGGVLRYQLEIPPYTQTLTRRYLDYRLSLVCEDATPRAECLFDQEAVAAIHRQSKGNLAAINRLADQALMSAYVANKSVVDLKHVDDAVRMLGWTQIRKLAGKTARPTIKVTARNKVETKRPSLPKVSARTHSTANGTSQALVHKLLREVTTIGRAADCSIQLDQSEISPCQALIVKTGDGMFVRNEGGALPVLLNASPVESAALRVGDTLRIGDYELSVTTQADGTPALVALTP